MLKINPKDKALGDLLVYPHCMNGGKKGERTFDLQTKVDQSGIREIRGLALGVLEARYMTRSIVWS